MGSTRARVGAGPRCTAAAAQALFIEEPPPLGIERCISIRTDLTAVKQAIEQNMSAFDHQATALEMMARVDRQLVELEEQRRQLDEAIQELTDKRAETAKRLS